MPRAPRKPPLVRLMVAGVVVLPVVAASVALATLLYVTTRDVAESLGGRIVETETARVSGEIASYLSEAVRVSDLYARRLAAGTLPTTGLTAWERPMADDLFTSRRVASICYANPAGEATYLQLARGRRELGRVDGPGEGQASEFEVHASGETIGPPLRVYRYDARGRPWYEAAVREGRPVWTPIWTPVYFWFGDAGGEGETGTGYTRTVQDRNGAFAGVLTVDVTLGALSDFLHDLPFAQSGYVFVVDDAGKLVAASHGGVNSPKGERLSLADSTEPVATALAAALARGGGPRGTGGAAGTDASLTLDLGTRADPRPAHARVTGARPFPGIDWRIMTVMPESVALAQARRAQRRATILAGFATLGALGLGLLSAKRLTGPLLRLTDHVRRVGAGDFDHRLALGGARELSQLADATNRMAAGLKERTDLEQSLALASEVQQSLLPAGMAPRAGLDVAGVSRYCDATGGDYFDFIDDPDDPARPMLIAVGDVTGHGVAAALLMATARAALRAGAAGGASHGELLALVNDLLARDARHARYMTMVLLSIDPRAGTVRYASAGHDPVIVFDPAAGTFVELRDGGLPLGAVDGHEYADHDHDGLADGSVLFVGTDGIWEATDPTGEMYGKDRLRAFIAANAHAPAADMAAALEADLATFRAGRPYKDDVTYVVIKLTGDHPALNASATLIACGP